MEFTIRKKYTWNLPLETKYTWNLPIETICLANALKIKYSNHLNMDLPEPCFSDNSINLSCKNRFELITFHYQLKFRNI